jgi:uncharacterized protein (UPF0335 family)
LFIHWINQVGNPKKPLAWPDPAPLWSRRPALIAHQRAGGFGSDKQKKDTVMAEVGGIAADRLRSVVERVERLEEEKAALTADIRDIYSEAKAAGFDVKTLRQIVRLRKLDQSDRDEQQALLDLYRRVLEI